MSFKTITRNTFYLFVNYPTRKIISAILLSSQVNNLLFTKSYLNSTSSILKALRLVFILSIPSTLKQAHEHGCNKIKVIF